MSLFAYSQAGFVVAHENEVRVWDPKIDAPRWWRPLSSHIASVGSAGALVSTLEGNGTLTFWNAADGSPAGGGHFPNAHSLAASEQGVAIANADAVVLYDANGRRALPVRGATALRFSRDGAMLGVGLTSGRVAFLEIASGKILHETRIPGGQVTSLAERVPGEWLAAAGSSVHLVGGSGVSRVTGISGTTITDVTSGPRSSLFAVVANKIAVAVEWPSKETIASHTYSDKTPLGVAFGRHGDDGFYVGLSGGDGNRRDLYTGDLYRTDPHPGHPTNRWMVMSGYEAPVAQRALSKA